MNNGIIAYSARDAHNLQQVFTIGENGSGKTQITTSNTGIYSSNGVPAWSPDGKHLLFTNADPTTGHSYIYRLDMAMQQRRRLAEGNAAAWSKDGQWIAYGTAITGMPEIWVMSADGHNQYQASPRNASGKINPSWSIDGRRISYSQFARDGSHVAVWVLDLMTGAAPITGPGFTNLDASGKPINPADDANAARWHPTGDALAIWSGVENHSGQVWTVRGNGTARQQLTRAPLPSNNDDPEWSPDGQKILFSTNRSGLPELWVMATDGTGERRITDTTAGPGLSGSASWQPKP